MDYFKFILKQGTKYQAVLGYSSLSLLAAVSETSFSTIVYKCPCNSYNYMYGLVFLLVPALILFMLGYILSIHMWQQFTSCCNEEGHCCLNGKVQNYLWKFLKVTFASALAPLTWIALALLKGTFYECIVSGLNWNYLKQRFCENKTGCLKILPQLPCISSSSSSTSLLSTLNLTKSNIENIQSNLRAESQIIGWTLIAAVLLVAVLSICAHRCCSPVRYRQRKFWKSYIRHEQKMVDKKTNELAISFAERNVTSFFEQTQPDPFVMPTSREWQRISSPYNFKANPDYYSMIHKLIEGNTKTNGENEASETV
ncbi:calcium homeostasis modulator protein 6-like [Pelobates fuscus]|uniref:calcium homeostasis modulator protein 6-like n=1 Tax=Pelobates fuscus TaxID=191477 RepID=UPI002FE4BE80